MFDLIERVQQIIFEDKKKIIFTILKIMLLLLILFIGISIGKTSKNSGYQETIQRLQMELANSQEQKQSYVSINNQDSLIMILIDDDYRFLTTSEFKTISQSLPEMKARKFILIDLKSNKKIIELESLKLSTIYQEIGKMEAQTDPDYYLKNIAMFPELLERKLAIEKKYLDLTQKVNGDRITNNEKERLEAELRNELQELNLEYPVNGYQWKIYNNTVMLKEATK